MDTKQWHVPHWHSVVEKYKNTPNSNLA